MSYPTGTLLQIFPGNTSGGVAPLTTSFQWKLDGVNILGATSSAYTTQGAGILTCVQYVTDSNLVTISDESAAETIISVTPSGATLTLGWQNTSTTATSNRVDISTNGSTWTEVTTITPAPAAGSTRSYTVTGLPYNTSYYLRAVAVNLLGEALLTSGVFYTPPQFALSGVTATATSPNTMDVNATTPSSPPASAGGGYLVEYGEFFALNTTSPTLPVTLSGLPGNTTVSARIYAYNLNGNSSKSLGPVSPTVSATTDGYADLILADSPRGYWKLQELSGPTIIDSSGNGNNGTLVGATTEPTNFFYGETGPLSDADNKSMRAIGGPHIDFGNPAELQIVGNITVEAWVKIPAFPANAEAAHILSKWYDGTNAGYGTWLEQASFTGFLKGGFYNGSEHYSSEDLNIYGVLGADNFPINVWHHVALTHDGTTRKLYLNGVLVDSTADAVGAMATSTNLCAFGRFYASANGSFGSPLTGSLAHLAVYNTALTFEQIQARVAFRAP